MELKPAQFKRILPMPVTLITTVDGKGNINGAPYSCVMPILRITDLIAIASALPRDTLANIRETGEFVVNVMGKPSFRKAVNCLKNYPPDVNELEKEGLEWTPSKKVSPPRVKDAVGWIEATLEQEIKGENYVLIIGKAVCSEINDAHWNGEALTETPVVSVQPNFWTLGETVARRDEFSEKV